MSQHTIDRALPGRRVLIAAFALAGLAAAATPALAQSKGEIRIAHVYSKTGPLEAYGKQTQTGLMMGLDYATNGTMTVGGKKIIADREGRPGQARRRQEPAGHRLRRRQGRHRRRADVVRRRAGAAAGGRGVQEDPAGRAGGRRFDHRRQVEQLHLPHRPQQLAGRDLERRRAWTRTGASIATLAQDYAFGRDGVKAFKDALKKAKIVHEEYLPPATTDFTAGSAAPVRRAEGQAGPQDHLDHLGRRRQSVQDRRPRPRSATASRSRPAATSCRRWSPTSSSPAWKARPTTTSASRRTRSTSGWSPTTTSSSRRRPISSPPAA